MSAPARFHVALGPKNEGSYIVMLKESAIKKEVIDWLIDQYGDQPEVKVIYRYNESDIIHSFAAHLSETALAGLLARDDVESIYEDTVTTPDVSDLRTQQG